MSVIAFSSTIGPIPIDCVLLEKNITEIDITENPIETGAMVHDHAYVKPKKVTLEIADSSGAAAFNALVRFQESRIPFVLVTGLSVYKNMLIRSIVADRDKDKASILSATVELQEVIIVGTSFVSGTGESVQGRAGQPGGVKSTRAANLSPERSSGVSTINRAAGTITRGDAPTTPANTSLLRGLF